MTQEFQQSQNIGLQQTQTQTLSAQQLQTLKLLQMTRQDLEQHIKQEMQQNPVLEVTSGIEIPYGNPTEDFLREGDYDPEKAADIAERDENLVEEVRNSHENDVKLDYAPSWDPDNERRREYMMSTLTEQQSLQEILLEQLRYTVDENKTPDLFRACEEVLGNLDGRGYLQASDADIAKGANVDEETARKAVGIIQSFSPAGIGGRDLREVLLLQLERANEKGSIAWDIVDKHLVELSRNKIPQIADSVDAEISEVQEALQRIRELDPHPGSALGDDVAPTVLPEIEILKNKEGDWTINLVRDAFPVVVISAEYLEMQKKAKSSSDRKYLSEKINSANQLINGLEFRKTTIEKISEVLLHKQLDFFENGPDHLKPLTRSKLADILGLSESTIGRALAGKYVRTPYGVMPFDDFFTAGIESNDGQAISNKVVQDRIVSLINSEDKVKPLSDQKIADLLEKEGIKVARRTVAKYREAAGIPETSLRRIHI